MYQAYVLYDAKDNRGVSYANLKRTQVKILNKMIPTNNLSQPWLIWILLPAWHETMRR